MVQQQLRLEGLSEEGRQWAKNPELKPKPKPERGMAFAIAHLDELIQKSQKKEQVAEENVASAQVPAVSELEAQAEMQTEAVKVEVLQSGEDAEVAKDSICEDAKTIVDSYWQQYCQMKDAEVAKDSICEDAKTIVDSYWQQYCQMKDAEVTKNSICEDAKAIVDSYWQQYCQMKDAEVAKNSICEDACEKKKAARMSTNLPVQNHKVTGLAKCLAMIWPPCGRY